MAAALVLAASGCIGASGGATGPDLLADDETGGIAGTVLTEELFPLQIANVNLTARDGSVPPVSAQVDFEGAFRFGHLAPGSYLLNASSPGFYPREATVEVRAGAIEKVNLVLVVRPSLEPYVYVSSWAGFNPCGFAFILTPANICDSRITNVTSGGPPRTGRNYTIWDGFAGVVGETTWSGGDEASAYYYNQSQEKANQNSSANRFSAVLDVDQGKAPLRVFLVPGQGRENTTQNVIAQSYQKVSDGGNFTLRYAVWWNGYYGDFFTPLNPVCNELAVPKCTGVGATISFRFTHWMSIFMYERPPDFKEYSVLPDQ